MGDVHFGESEYEAAGPIPTLGPFPESQCDHQHHHGQNTAYDGHEVALSGRLVVKPGWPLGLSAPKP